MAEEITTPLADMATQMHEAYQAFCTAGFSESQALTLVIGMATQRNG